MASLIIGLIVFGFIGYLVAYKIPMLPIVRTIIIGIMSIFILIWVIQFFGIATPGIRKIGF